MAERPTFEDDMWASRLTQKDPVKRANSFNEFIKEFGQRADMVGTVTATLADKFKRTGDDTAIEQIGMIAFQLATDNRMKMMEIKKIVGKVKEEVDLKSIGIAEKIKFETAEDVGKLIKELSGKDPTKHAVDIKSIADGEVMPLDALRIVRELTESYKATKDVDFREMVRAINANLATKNRDMEQQIGYEKEKWRPVPTKV